MFKGRMLHLINSRIHRIHLLCIYIAFAGANEKTCSSLSRLPVTENSKLKGAVIESFTTTGLASCAKECLLRSMCRSYNFQLDDGTCELSSEDGPNTDGSISMVTVPRFVFSESKAWPQGILGGCKDHSCPNNTMCTETEEGGHECILAYCREPPTVENVAPLMIRHFTPINQSLKCNVGYVPCGNMTCNPDGTWTTMTCMPVSNCTEVQQLSSTYTDGEYWLYPRQLSGVRVKVYCHAMNSTPSEYISLPTPYFMDSPRIQNYHCNGESPSDNYRLGYYVFSKFGLNIETMEIEKSDRVFYNMTGTLTVKVGEVRDCYTQPESSCSPKGRGVMDLRGTGLALNETVKWFHYRQEPIVTRSSNDQLIEVRCGGWCGGCQISGPALLSVVDSDAPLETTAITPSCDV
ncbi:uncharacterized protein LOC124151652 [Haliotis rufescens]|uniref:uncharacterized protein LOC124151652 n=1 Tax=Haliotis rufescens TaxID=6454 RepID=UPI00201EDF29|nr:uncharacterized protein LOC124151652 [Haliotis rufescens]